MSKTQWGNSAWFLFHTLAEKLKPQYSSSESPRLLASILNICHNLPCEDCSNHAMQNIRQLNTRIVHNKETLQHFLWRLHNTVNRQLGKRQHPFDICKNKYKLARTNNIIAYFNTSFHMATHTNTLTLHSGMKKNAKNNMMNYLRHNIHKFNN